MNLLNIAWRNIWRNRLRSLAVIFSVTLGLFAGIFSSALVEGMMNGRFQNFIEKELSHIQIHHPDFVGQEEVFQTTGISIDILEHINLIPEVKSATVRTKTQSMIASATYTGGVQLIGVEPNFEQKTTGFAGNIIEGKYITDDDKNAIVIGKALAEKMKVSIGSRIVLTFQDIDNEIISAAFRVKGLFETHSSRFDESMAYTNIHYLNGHLNTENTFHEMAILAKQPEELSILTHQLKEKFSNVSVREWNEIAPEMNYWVQLSSIFSYIFIGVILVGLAFGLLNTMLMAVFERTRELGMLLAIGMNKIKVFNLIVLETIILSIVGAAVGLFAGVLVIKTTQNTGIDLSAFSDVMREIGFENIIYPELNKVFISILPVLVMVTALLAAIYPAIKALKLNPAESVRK